MGVKFDFESHLSYNINKILSELIQEIIIYGYHASDTLKDNNILRFYNRIEQLYFTIRDIIKEDKVELIDNQTKEIMKKIQKQKRVVESIEVLEEVKQLFLFLIKELQDRQYFFRMVDYRNKTGKKIEKEIFDSHNSFDTNKIISVQMMTIVGAGSEAGDYCDFLSHYKYYNRLDMLYLFIRPIILLEEKELDYIRDKIIYNIKLFELNPNLRTIINLTEFSKTIRDFHKKIINLLQKGRYLFRIRTLKDKSLSSSSIFFESSVYGD